MSLENVHYDAFISYRHCELDMFVAKNLHKTLEAFKLPSGIAKEHPELPRKIERVFRDQEELPLVSNLAEPITEALKNSDNLIVICTPRLRESLWCQKEIETFIGLHGREHVFAVLAEGEPDESFPPQLLVDEQGKPVEPLGADFRGSSNREILKKMKNESLRLIAPMFDLNFDDLRQRHKEQKARRTISICTIIIALLAAFGIYSTSMALLIKQQAMDIEARNEQITAQNEEIEKQNVEIREKTHDIALKYALTVAEDSDDVISLGDKQAAIRMLRDVLPDDKTDELLPYTPECERALADCMGIYYAGNNYLPSKCIKADGEIGTLGVSEDGKYMFYGVDGGKLFVVDTDTWEEVYSTNLFETVIFNDAVIVGHKLFYSDSDNNLRRYDIDTKEDKVLFDKMDSVVKIEGHKYVYGYNLNVVEVFNADNDDNVIEIPVRPDDIFYDAPTALTMSEDEKYLYVDYTPGLRKEMHEGMFRIYDLQTGEVVDEVKLGVNRGVTSFAQDGNMLYAAIREQNDAFFTTDWMLAYDMDAKQIKYMEKDSNRWLKDLRVVEKDGKKYLFAIDDYQPLTFDIETGELIVTTGFETYVLDSIDMGDGYEALVMRNGELCFYIVDTGFSLSLDNFVHPFSERVAHFQRGKGIFLFHSYFSDVIGVYKAVYDSPLEPIEGTPEYQKLTLDDREIDIPAHNLKLISSTETGVGLYDADGKCIALLRDCYGYDEKTDKLIYQLNGEYFAMPIFSYEEILKAADDYLASVEK